nr:MAG TPA: Ciliary BBSome complex subunit 1 [Caudoviricetes sp.]
MGKPFYVYTIPQLKIRPCAFNNSSVQSVFEP